MHITLPMDSISLNGNWKFQIDSINQFDINNLNKIEWRDAKVPLSWQAQFADLRDYQGIAWYKKIFTLPVKNNSDVILIEFGAVDYSAEIFINKNFAGKHEGGYTPFRFDISEFINEGENELVVRVVDPANDETGTEGTSFWHIPHGKQTWYVHTSGIWQNVNIIIKPELFIKNIFITPTINGVINIQGSLNKRNDGKDFKFTISDPSGNIVLTENKKSEKKDEKFSFTLNINNPLLWHFDSPNLYNVQVIFGEDIVNERFGFRSIEAKDKKLYLNGEPFYLIAALDQDFYPESIYTTPSEEYIRDQMLKAKQLGLNMLRCHIKVPDPLYLKVADEVGLLIWYELPNWGQFTYEAAARGSETIDRMLERDWNNPSLIIVGIINESWGIDLQKEDQRNWLLNEFDRVKEKAAGKLVVDNSACWGNFHLKTDINDYHTYWSIPDNKSNFDETIKEISNRPKWLFSEFGDSKETGDEPLLVSEFGNWGLPKMPAELPWWIERKFLDIDISLPKDYQKRFYDYKYDEIFKDYDELAEESQRAQFRALKYEIETIRMFPEIQGYVITEFTDINWEANGLLDMWRNFKIYSDDIPFIQQQDVIIPRPVKYNFENNEEIEIKIFISHYSSHDFNNASLKWKSSDGQSGKIDIPKISRADVKEISPVKFRAKKINQPENIRIDFELILDGKIIAKNFTDIFVFQSDEKVNEGSLTVYDPNSDLTELSKHLSKNFNIEKNGSIILSNILDENILNKISNGASVICLIDSNTIFPSASKLKVISRQEEWYDGNWASNFNWKRNNYGIFDGINFTKSFGFETAGTSPKWVIDGVPAEKFSNVLAGMFVSWIHLNSGFIVQVNHNKGRLILCSFPITENYSSDPFAKKLLSNIIKYIGSEDFKSNLSW
jgi:hypothetical protein